MIPKIVGLDPTWLPNICISLPLHFGSNQSHSIINMAKVSSVLHFCDGISISDKAYLVVNALGYLKLVSEFVEHAGTEKSTFCEVVPLLICECLIMWPKI